VQTAIMVGGGNIFAGAAKRFEIDRATEITWDARDGHQRRWAQDALEKGRRIHARLSAIEMKEVSRAVFRRGRSVISKRTAW